MATPAPPSPRLDSVDALRGLTVAAMIFVNGPGDWAHLWWPFAHAAWHGCTPTDLVFPAFLFLVGVSLALAGGPRRDAGTGLAALQRAWGWRALRILLLGWLLAAAIAIAFGSVWRPLGVLQRIAICFAVAGWLYLHATPTARWVVWSVLLLGYGLLLQLSGDLGPGTDWPSRLDTALLGKHAWRHDPATGLGHEPEGLLSTLGALATTLFGAACGDWLRRRQLGPLVAAGLVSTLAGLALHLTWLPMNKALWTPPYALFTGGLAALALAAAHALVDRRGWPAIGRRFGINAITAYAGSMLLVCVLGGVHLQGRPLHDVLYGPLAAALTPGLGAAAASHTWALAQVVLWWLVLRWMDARRLRISI